MAMLLLLHPQLLLQQLIVAGFISTLISGQRTVQST
jgi:hypothetical protein